MIRYLVFAYMQYYPSGPRDIVGRYVTYDEAHARALEEAKNDMHDWVSIYDVQDGTGTTIKTYA